MPDHVLERVPFAVTPVLVAHALTETPTVNRQRDDAFLGDYRSVGWQNFAPGQQFVFASRIRAAMPVDVKQAGRGFLPFVRNEQQRGDRLDAVQIEREIFERIAVPFFCPDQLRRFWARADWKIAEQAPEQFATFLLVSVEFSLCFERLRGAHWGTA